MTDPKPKPAPELVGEAGPELVTLDDTPETGWAVYDVTLERFTSGVLPTRKEATAAMKLAPAGHTTAVRAV